MVAPVGYSDISLSFSPEAFYTGIPGADVSRGMLYGQGKAEKLHMDTRLQMELTEKERQFNESLAEKIREYDSSLGFGKEQFEFFKEQYEDQYGLQKDWFNLAKNKQNQGSSGFDMNKFLDRMGYGSGPSQTPFPNRGHGDPGTQTTHWDKDGNVQYGPQYEPQSFEDMFGDEGASWLNDQAYGYNLY